MNYLCNLIWSQRTGYHHFCDLHFPLLINQSHSHSGMMHNSVPYGLSVWLLATTRRAWTPSLQGRAQQTVSAKLCHILPHAEKVSVTLYFDITKLFCLFVFLFFGFDGLVLKKFFFKEKLSQVKHFQWQTDWVWIPVLSLTR